jgi:hypothetical protein
VWKEVLRSRENELYILKVLWRGQLLVEADRCPRKLMG